MNKYDPTITDYIDREVNLLPFNICTVSVMEAPDYPNPPMACFSVEDGKPHAQFYTKVIEQNLEILGDAIVKQGGIQKYIQRVVRHECRHYMQYEYFNEHGIDYDFALKIEDKFEYGKGPLETDAKAFANGIDNSLEDLSKKYYSEGNGYQAFKEYDKSNGAKKKRRRKK